MPQYVSFHKPPVVEVVCGVRFDAHGRLKVAHIGAFWTSLREAFPVVEDVPPILQASGMVPSLELSPRSWLIASDGSVLMQLQKDWFLLNWKKSSDDQSYPSYEVVKREFDRRFREFVNFLQSNDIELEYKQFELTYVNHIASNNGIEKVGEWRLLVDHNCSDRERFLPHPTEINWKTSYLLPNDSGRLNVTAQTGRVTATGERIVRLDLQATGLPTDDPEQHMDDWFETAHEWITRGFADVTTPELHEIWERKA
jgi:uncharacterized protein (TIGR04255 family)